MQQMILLFWYLKDDDLNYCGRCCQLESWRNDFFVPSFLIVRRCILYCWRFVSAVLSTNDGMIWYDVCCTAAGDAKMPDASQSSQVDDRTDLRCYSYTETWKIRPRPRQWMDSVGWVNLMNLHWRKCTRGAARTICRLDSWRRWLLASLFESPHQWWYNRFGSSLLIISLLFAVLCRWYYYSQPCWLFFRFRDVLWAVRTSLLIASIDGLRLRIYKEDGQLNPLSHQKVTHHHLQPSPSHYSSDPPCCRISRYLSCLLGSQRGL